MHSDQYATLVHTPFRLRSRQSARQSRSSLPTPCGARVPLGGRIYGETGADRLARRRRPSRMKRSQRNWGSHLRRPGDGATVISMVESARSKGMLQGEPGALSTIEECQAAHAECVEEIDYR